MKLCVQFLATLLILGIACKKEKLTKATQTGANTFSCKVDGIVFKPSEKGGLFGGEPLFVSNYPLDGFTLSARKFGRGSTPHTDVLMKLPYLKSIGIYPLNVFPGYGQFQKDFAGGTLYQTNLTHTGSANITRCDTINKIFSGTFSFTAIDANTGKTVNITDGRFDVKR